MTGALMGLLVSSHAFAAAQGKESSQVQEARATLATFEKTDPGLSKFVESSAGYVVFTSIGKGAVGVGGAHGTGILFEHGKAMGKATMNQVTVGLQLGGQSYSQVMFFQTPKVLADFKDGKFALSAEASAVALKTGVAANAKFQNGVAIFTAAKGGLMYEASVGGQKFKYQSFGKETKPSA